MRTLLHPARLHPVTGDPGVWIDIPDEGRAVLLDLPSIELIPPRKLLRLSHAVVTHTHMDHFVGFDQLLRVTLRRERPLAITGPPGFLASERGRIGAYSWNLIDGLIIEEPGQVVVYLTDLAGNDENFSRAEEFARNADLLFCEAAFLDADRALAEARKHLTAKQAGTLARRAGAKRLAVFHLSPRYEGREAEVLREAGEAFGAPMLEMR